jgi:hypothetical protein
MSHLPRDHEKGINGREDGVNSSIHNVPNGFGDFNGLRNVEAPSADGLHRDAPSEEALRKIRTANSISISPGKWHYQVRAMEAHGKLIDDRVVREDVLEPPYRGERWPAGDVWEPYSLSSSRLPSQPEPTLVPDDGLEELGWRRWCRHRWSRFVLLHGRFVLGSLLYESTGWDITDGDKGGLLMTLGGVLEFFLGNTFSFVVFCSFGTATTLPPDEALLVQELNQS